MRRLLATCGLLLLAGVIVVLLRRSDPEPVTEGEGSRAEMPPTEAPAVVPLDARPSARPAVPAAGERPPEPVRRLEVLVRTARGLSVAGATAFVEDTDPVAQGATTDAEGRAALDAPAAGWVLVRTREGVWARAPLRADAARIDVEVPVEPRLRGRVMDEDGRPAPGVRVRVRGAGWENPARAWPAVRRWEMRSEVGEVVTDASGAFEVAGLADLAGGFQVDSPDGEFRSVTGPEAWLTAAGSGRFVVGRTATARIDVRDAVSDGPVLSAQIAPLSDGAPRGLRVEERGSAGSFTIHWARHPDGSAPRARVQIAAPGFVAQEVDLDPMAAPGPGPGADTGTVVARLARGEGVRASAVRLRMPRGVVSPLPSVLVSVSVRVAVGRGYGTTGRLVNRGAYWELARASDPGRYRLTGVLGLAAPEFIEVGEGEIVEADLTGPEWGRVVLRLRADADLCRGEFRAEASKDKWTWGSSFQVVADETGRADAGWWPPGPLIFHVSRTAEAGTSEPVDVRPGPEPTVVEIPVRNLLGR